MRRWGLVIALSYGLLVLVLAGPAWAALFVQPFNRTGHPWVSQFVYLSAWAIANWGWVIAIVLTLCQALLLFLSVDTGFRRNRARAHIAVTIGLASFFATVLVVAGAVSLDEAISGFNFLGGGRESFLGSLLNSLRTVPSVWLIWALVFYLHLGGSSRPVSAAVDWLLKGSVMELLIALPSHVVARQRDNCCGGIITSMGIATGLAIMLFAFGPGVLALYKKRIDSYRKPAKPA